jgi:anti-anti-sigma factor
VFSVTVVAVDEEVLVTCSGELDMVGADRFRIAFEEALNQQPRRIHLDCSTVTFVDSIGVKALLRASRTCIARLIALTLTASEPMRRLFDTIGMASQFTYAP